jgi:LPS export ABC transporter protein LptC
MILRALAAAAVIALLGIAWLALHGLRDGPVAPVAAAIAAQNPGYSARDAVLIETGADGLPIYTLRAAEVHQQPASRTALLDRVEMQFRDAAGRVWHGRADEARVSDQASEVDLAGAVTLSGLPSGSSEAARISTDRLSVDTRTEVVKTKDPLTLDWGGRQIRARGLLAQLREGRLQLESNVHGRYVP